MRLTFPKYFAAPFSSLMFTFLKPYDFILLCCARNYKKVGINERSCITPEPRPFKMGTFDSNAGIGAVGSGDMSSTRNNQIWSSANSFFRNNWVWPFFACFLERWLSYGSQFFLNWPVHQNLILNLNMEQKTKHKFFMLLCKKMKNKGISKIEFWPL